MSILSVIKSFDVVKDIGKGVGNLLDRKWPKKMSQKESADLFMAKIDKDIEQGKIAADSVADARKMFMVELRTQKQPWLVRSLLGIYRPIAGFAALWVAFYPYFRTFWPETLPVVALKQYEFIGVMAVVTTIIIFFFGSAHKGGMSSPERKPGE